MKLAISNIAWHPSELESVLEVMVRVGARGLEIAPGLAFAGEEDPFCPSRAAVQKFTRLLSSKGISTVSMQSLLFGVHGAHLFGSNDETRNFETGIERAIRLAGQLRVPNIVLGSPKNRRYPKLMTQGDASIRAAAVLAKLADVAVEEGTKIAIEPNPAEYGTNFLNTLEETASFVAEMAHPGVAMNFDIGAYRHNKENLSEADIFDLAARRISHVHVSEFGLRPAPENKQDFSYTASAIMGQGYNNWFSIEMRRPEVGALDKISEALDTCASILRGMPD